MGFVNLAALKLMMLGVMGMDPPHERHKTVHHRSRRLVPLSRQAAQRRYQLKQRKQRIARLSRRVNRQRAAR